MCKDTVFCENCREDVPYTVSKKIMTATIKGNEYSYLGKETRCSKCRTLIYVSEIVDENLKSLYDVFRNKNGIVSLETIRAIPEKYAIGKRPLSILLGWGEQTFSRYCDGDIPTKQYSEILSKIYDDPGYYAEILESGKDRLRSVSTYNKSKKAVDEILNISEKDNSKIDIVAKYLISQCEDITPLALQKALYYVQGFYCAFNNSFLFQEDCEAWTHGPVFRDVYFKYRDYHFETIPGKSVFDDSIFTTSEKVIIDSVIRYFCCYSGKILEKFTHQESPWVKTRGDLPMYSPSNRIISTNLIREYFGEVKSKYEMVDPNDIRLYAEDMFQSIN